MGSHSDGYVEQELLTTFVTCEGDLSDPQFNTKFARLLKQLQKLLLKDSGQYLGVVKVEPWNSVRVTFTVPKEAALRLRQLAQQRDVTLSQLGILSVQLEGDQAISLRFAGRVSGEAQEIVLRTTPADTESIGGQTPAPESDHMISKSVTTPSAGSTASFFRTMSQVLSGTSVNQSLTAFKTPTANSPNNLNTPSAFVLPPKASSSAAAAAAAAATTNPANAKTTLSHSYHSPFIATNTSTVASPIPTAMASASNSFASAVNASSPSTSGYRFSVPPPPYPNSKATPSHLIRSNRAANEDVSANPSPANVAISSPLLVNLLQTDGGVPVCNNRAAVLDRQKLLKAPGTIKSMVPATSMKRKDGALETFANMNQLQPADGSTSFVSVGVDSQVVQRFQKASASEPPTMVTNVRIPGESCGSDSVIVSSGKLPTMNHLTAVTANVPPCYSSQNSLVNMFPRQMNTVASSSTLANQPKSSLPTSVMNNQLMNRVMSGQNETSMLTVGQNQKFDLRVINMPSSQHQLLQSQQLLQQQFHQSQPPPQPLLLQQQQQQQQPHQQQLVQQPKSVILPQSTSGAKINAAVQELNKFNMNANAPIVPSLTMAGNRIQFPRNQSLPLASNGASNLNDSKFDCLLTDRNGLADVQGVMDQMPVANIGMAEASTAHLNKPDGRSSIQGVVNSVVTCTPLQVVKTFTLTNANVSQNSFVPSKVTASAAHATTKMSSIVYNSGVASSDKSSGHVPQMIPSSVAHSLYSLPSTCYQNTVVTNTSAMPSNTNTSIAGNQISDLQSLAFSKPELSTAPDSDQLIQSTSSFTANSLNNSKITPVGGPTYTGPPYSEKSIPSASSAMEETANDNQEPSTTAGSSQTQFIGGEKEPQFLINPLTGEMEAMPLESSDNESDNQTDIFNSLPPSVANNDDSCFSFTDTMNEKSNSIYSDDEDDTVGSASVKKETDSSEGDAVKNYNGDSAVPRHRVLSSGGSGSEKIKIRLKLEKHDPTNNAYKLDVLNTNLKKVDKPTSIVKPMPRVLTTSASSAASVQSTAVNTAVDEPRVPPIRLSLRGKSVAFVKKNKKWSDDTKDTVSEDNGDRKPYFGKNKISSEEVISEKDCISSDSVDLCKSIESVEDSDEMKSKTVKKKSADPEESQPEGVSDAISSYNPILSSVRTFPTEAEVTSILRSVPSDGNNKMSLSTMKIKKKETKKKTFVRDRASALSSSVLGDDATDTFTRVINETKCTLSSQSRGKSKSNPSSLLKSVMKSTAAKEARMINLANRSSEKRAVAGDASNLNPKVAGAMSSNVQQRRSSADVTYTVNNSVFTNVKVPQKGSSETFAGSPQQFVANAQTTNSVYGNAHSKEAKKFVGNSTGPKKMVNCKSKEYQNSKNEVRKDFHLNNESKKGSQVMKRALDAECKQQSSSVNCIQLEPTNPSVSGLTSLPTTNLDLSEKIMKQRLLDDGSLGEPSRKKPRLDAADGGPKSISVMDSLLTLPHSNNNDKESEVSIATVGGESPSGPSNEQTNNQGEDSGIESMDALSEKSPNQGESPCRKDEKDPVVLADVTSTNREKKLPINAYCDKTAIDTMSPQDTIRRDDGENRNNADVNAEVYSKSAREDTCELQLSGEKADKGYDRSETVSPDLDDVQPFRVTPALYTYSNEKIRQDTPSPVPEDITDEIMSPKSMTVEHPKAIASSPSTTASTRLKRKRKEPIDPIYVTTDKPEGMNRYNNRSNVSSPEEKSLLKQLLIHIPSESSATDLRRSGVSTRNTRSQVKGLSQPSPDTLSVGSTSSSSSIRTPKCSPIPRAEEASTKQSPRTASRLTSRRSRKGSESSNLSTSDDTPLLGVNKKKSPENGPDLMRACLGFEDHNGKKIAVSALASADCYRTIIGESSATASTMLVSNTKTGAGRAVGSAAKRGGTPSLQITDTTAQNAVETRPVGKRRRTANDTPNVRRNLVKSQQDSVEPLVQVASFEESEKSVAPATPTRGNNRLSAVTVKQSSATPSTSRRSVRQNHITRRRKSPATATDEPNTANSLTSASNSNNNNNSTNKNNNNAGKLTASHSETPKNPFHEKGILVNAEKAEGKSPAKANNCITKKEAALLAPAGSVCNNLTEVKSNHAAASGTGAATVTTRGHSVKQTHSVNDSAIVTPPQDLTHVHTVPASEEVINTRRKTRSIANSNATSDAEHGSRRRRNSRDGK